MNHVTQLIDIFGTLEKIEGERIPRSYLYFNMSYLGLKSFFFFNSFNRNLLAFLIEHTINKRNILFKRILLILFY